MEKHPAKILLDRHAACKEHVWADSGQICDSGRFDKLAGLCDREAGQVLRVLVAHAQAGGGLGVIEQEIARTDAA
eukprot:6181778-Pleurochrysis_carterae.AAC.2